MVPVDVLFPELLADIMVLAAGRLIEFKMAVAGVSRKWRGIALTSPLLWATFDAFHSRQFQDIPLVLSRSLAVPLDAQLEFIDIWGTESSPVQRDAALRALLPHANRLKRLYICFYNIGATHQLLNQGQRLPLLRDFTHVCQKYSEYQQPEFAPLWLELPNVETLVLKHAAPRSWCLLLSPALTTLSIIECPSVDSSLLAMIFSTCVKLEDFTLRENYPMTGRMAILGLHPPSPDQRWEAPSLRSLDLELHFKDLLDVLTGLSGKHLTDVTIAFATPSDWNDFPLFRSILDLFVDGLDAIVSIDVRGQKDVRLVDDKGDVRHVTASNMHNFAFSDYWSFLFRNHKVSETLRDFGFPSSFATIVAGALEPFPLPPSTPISLTILMDGEPMVDRRDRLAVLPGRLCIPNLAKVVLLSDLISVTLPAVLKVLDRLRTDTQHVDVCVGNLEFHSHEAGETSRRLLTKHLRQKLDGTRWRLCQCNICDGK